MHVNFASAVILILRLYALCDRSRRVLFFLLGLFLPIVALEVGIDIYLYSRTSAFSGGFDLCRIGCNLKLTSSHLDTSDRVYNTDRQVLYILLQPRAHACDLYFYPHHMLRHSSSGFRGYPPRKTHQRMAEHENAAKYLCGSNSPISYH